MSTFSALITAVSNLATHIGNSVQLRGFKEGGTAGQVPVKTDGTDFNWSWGTFAGGGDVVGPSGATNNAVAVFDGTTGKLLKNGVVLGTAATSNTGDFAAAAHTHLSADITDATVSGTANRVVIRGAAGQANFNATTGSTAVGGVASGTGGGGLFTSVGGMALAATSTTGIGAVISSQDGTGATISSDTGTHLNVGFDALVVNSDGDTVLGGNVSALNLEGTNTGDLPTNGTNGQALTSNGSGGFGTAVTLGTAATTNSTDYAAVSHTHVSDNITDSTSDGINNPERILIADTNSRIALGGLELGHLTDTTITRASAGVIAVEGVSVSMVGHTHTASNITDFSSAVAATAAVTANTAKVSNATHTGDATGSGALTVVRIQGVDIPAPVAGDDLKYVRYNHTTGDFDYSAPSGSGDALTSSPLSQFAATTSAQLAGVISDETGSGALVFATSPTLVTPALGTPSSGTLTNCTGLPAAGVTGLGTLATQSGTFSGTSSGTNTGDQTSIVGITGTTAQFNTALSDGDFATLAGSETLANKTLTNPTVNNYTEGVVAIGNSGTSQTLDITSGTFQTVTLTGNCTFTMPTATAGKSFILKVLTGAGSYTAAFTGVKWSGGSPPVITATASKYDLISFVADGTAWSGSIIQNFTP